MLVSLSGKVNLCSQRKYVLVVVFKVTVAPAGISVMTCNVLPLRMFGLVSLHGDPVDIHSCCGKQ